MLLVPAGYRHEVLAVGGNHYRSACENEEPQCPNCKKTHDCASIHCPILRIEKRIHNYKVENNVGFLAAMSSPVAKSILTLLHFPSPGLAQ
ncbi:hypothetical protein MRX96_025411 [Rhipicephalus microplus]